MATSLAAGWLPKWIWAAPSSPPNRESAGDNVRDRGMAFLQPVCVGDTVACYAWVEKIGRTSMTIPVEVWVHRYMTGEEIRVTRAVFIYVAVDAKGKPIPVKRAS